MSSWTLDRDRQPSLDQLVSLYDSVGWRIYTADPDRLQRAIRNAHWLATAWEGDRLLGLCRTVGDGETVCCLQDILVRPDAQRRGIGRALVQACLDDHAHIRQLLLLTDDRPEQLAFYRSLGLSSIRELNDVQLNCFVRFAGVDLT
jgi:GNAT superfamily N-acetyltransferase